MQDSFLGHIWFVQMGPTLELLPNAPYHKVQLKDQDRNSLHYEGTERPLLRNTSH